jgi:pimeloyl-ACP methyl ester carboxylesterase
MNVPSVCRLHLSAAALGALTLAWSAPSFAQDPAPKAVKNILLVHGSWADGSSWAKVITRLEAQGYHAKAVQLSLTSLPDDAATLRRAIALEDGRVLLVAHSYGGAVVTVAGDDPKVTGLVYVAAFAPDAGQSVASLVASVAPAPINNELSVDAYGFLKVSMKGIFADFAQDLVERERQVIADTQGPSSVNCFLGTITNPAWRIKPSWYLVAEDDRAIPPTLEQAMAQTMDAHTIHVRSSHLVMLSHPEAVVQLIDQATGGE